jgi:hypothetical protein
VRSFREQFTHLIGENFYFMAQAAGETPPLEMSAIEKLKSRDDIMQALKDSYEYGAKVWTGMTDQRALEMIAGRGGQPQATGTKSIIDTHFKPNSWCMTSLQKAMLPSVDSLGRCLSWSKEWSGNERRYWHAHTINVGQRSITWSSQ